MKVDIDTIKERLSAKKIYDRALDALRVSDFQDFFGAASMAERVIIRSQVPLCGCGFWAFMPGDVGRIDERLHLDTTKLKILSLWPFESDLAIHVHCKYEWGTTIIEAYFSPGA